MDAKWYRLATRHRDRLDERRLVRRALPTRPRHYRELLKKTLAIHAELRREWPRLAEEYRAALGDITSPEAWEKTLAPVDDRWCRRRRGG
jgi:galactofuranosylgalactofuranosylrhamnosyl-N-acetylglucosaminyl-diphospho-decaprenol beta-1,5/1,6-galactofuranosyltransferase